jgi:Sulfotransferase family
MNLEIEVVPTALRPMARTSYYGLRSIRAYLLARRPIWRAKRGAPPIFIIGCGRSGTTLAGRLFGLHPAVRYLNEPFDLWAAIDPTTDILQLYRKGECRALLDGSLVTDVTRARFRSAMRAKGDLTLVEKSPINALRIGYILALEPSARFVHIVRDGVDVVRSIQKMASVTNSLAFRPSLNDWWGIEGAKWEALERDGAAASYYENEVSILSSDAQRGAYEWLVSMREVDDWRERLQSRLVEFRYEDLSRDPRSTLQGVVDALGFSCPGSWLNEAASQVRQSRKSTSEPLRLPEKMCIDFNIYQERFGFSGRAVPLVD